MTCPRGIRLRSCFQFWKGWQWPASALLEPLGPPLRRPVQELFLWGLFFTQLARDSKVPAYWSTLNRYRYVLIKGVLRLWVQSSFHSDAHCGFWLLPKHEWFSGNGDNSDSATSTGPGFMSLFIHLYFVGPNFWTQLSFLSKTLVFYKGATAVLSGCFTVLKAQWFPELIPYSFFFFFFFFGKRWRAQIPILCLKKNPAWLSDLSWLLLYFLF